jgi:hypothetical protein
MDHPFIVKLHYAFQTKSRLFLIVDLLPGVQSMLLRVSSFICFEKWENSAKLWPNSMLHRSYSLSNIFIKEASSIEISNHRTSSSILRDTSRSLTLVFLKLCIAQTRKRIAYVGLHSIWLHRLSWEKDTLKLLIGLAM